MITTSISDELVNRIKSKLDDVYFGRADSFSIGGVTFTRHGVAFNDELNAIKSNDYNKISVSIDGDKLLVLFMIEQLPTIAVEIPIKSVKSDN